LTPVRSSARLAAAGRGRRGDGGGRPSAAAAATAAAEGAAGPPAAGGVEGDDGGGGGDDRRSLDALLALTQYAYEPNLALRGTRWEDGGATARRRDARRSGGG